LQWNPYESWDGGVEGYRIYRRINDNPVADLLIPLDNMTYTFTDDVSAMSASGNKISYFVEAYEGYGNPYGFLESSYSNEVLALQEAKVYMPNAFLPEGMNTTLKPVMVFAGTENYLFAIYNRWGQLLFLTNDPEEGWNGIYKGSYVSQDVYVYLIRFSNVLGDALEKSGTVAVIF
jgi:gliding motility-associated-like protein